MKYMCLASPPSHEMIHYFLFKPLGFRTASFYIHVLILVKCVFSYTDPLANLTPHGPLFDQYFRAPDVNPLTMYFCASKKKSKLGITAYIPAAHMRL